MSVRGSPSPLQMAANNQAEETMPKGHCRYILLQTEIKGQRCACVSFKLKKGFPSATCDCGHLSCYHNPDPEPSSDQKHEVELLKKRVQQLEDQLSKGQEDVLESVVRRLNEMEEHLEKSRDEFGEQIKAAYRNVSVSWRSIEQVERKHKQQDAQLGQIIGKLGDHDEQLDRLQAGQMELRDADLSLEERIENLTETLEEEVAEAFTAVQPRGRGRRPRRRSTSDTSLSRPTNLSQSHHNHHHPLGPLGPLGGTGGDGSHDISSSSSSSSHFRRLPSPVTHPSSSGGGVVGLPNPRGGNGLPPNSPASARSTGAWTVHISLLPHAFVPMPFERNTNAYQRCLSRGLHQVVAINGPDAESFARAVSKAFGSLLKGREWMPLQAKLCDAQQLQGLPMLRQLEPHLLDLASGRYDHEFLRKYCAVCDAGGMIDSLYIAMRGHSLSWHALRNAPVFMEGLEGSWAYDPFLDGNDPYYGGDSAAVDDGDRPAAGEISVGAVQAQASSSSGLVVGVKRPLTEISRANSFGAAGGGGGQSSTGGGGGGVGGENEGPAAGGGAGQARAVKRSCPVAPSTAGSLLDVQRRRVETM
ncbi:hypothetical protein QBC46DRAFT_366828 [Diplogelasinospora grovesii]|uniref:Uncharacterized protein n=1 Tax=Diplogelasinospora grovesii TaxID=303347 RepID=A0AAN6N363_9PEZI|nr:hypothetical protein QBC46DRAFT_366828 [Diplogelasinospora grovesii]